MQLFFQTETTQFPADRLKFNQDQIEVRPQTKPTNIGLGLVSVLAAERLGLLSEAEANQRLQQMFDSLQQLERWQGFFYDWYDSKSGEKLTHWPNGGHELDQFLSSVDNAWLVLSLLVLEKAKPELAEEIRTKILNKMDFDFFFDQEEQELRGGYSVSRGQPSSYHYPRELISEPRIIHWANAALAPNSETRREIFLRLLDKNGQIPHLASGGSMFELLMPRLLLREKYLDSSIGSIFYEHKEYGKKYLGGAVGVSVADDPTHDNHYREMGVGGLYNSGSVVSSHGMALALLKDPNLAIQTMKQLEGIPGFYGKYGYMDAVDVQTGRVTNTQIFLDQAMVFLSLFSRCDDYLRKMFLSHFES